jgi:hypothetical protein
MSDYEAYNQVRQTARDSAKGYPPESPDSTTYSPKAFPRLDLVASRYPAALMSDAFRTNG